VGDLPVPPHFDPGRVGEVWRVDYEARAAEAEEWARHYGVPPAAEDRRRLCLLAVDVQNTFCAPGFELFVAGRSGRGAVEDNVRLCEFLYRNLARITDVVLTMDTHQALQIFHAAALVGEDGGRPAAYTLVSVEDVERGVWRFDPDVARSLGMSPEEGEEHLRHYVRRLAEGGKYELTIWPYHAMLGGIGHALVSAVEEAVFFHSVARRSRPHFEVKGDNPLTEHYSVLGPEVADGADGRPIAQANQALVERLLRYDAVVVAGQAKSHCVAWTIDDLLRHVQRRNDRLAEKVYLLEDCTSPVVVPGVVDYTEAADAAFARFKAAGMHVVRSTEPVEEWPGMPQPVAASPR
jgi:nicotinamidase-related amidase